MRIIAAAGARRWWPRAALFLVLVVGAGCAPVTHSTPDREQELPVFPPYKPGQVFIEEQNRTRKETLAKRAFREAEMKRNRRKRFVRHYLEWEPIHRRIVLAEAARARESEK